MQQLKGMASKLTAGACAHSCGKPGSSSASEHDAAQAVHPDMSMDSADSYNDAKALLPVVQELNSTSTKDDQEGNLGDDVPAGVPVSARSSQAARLSQAARPSQDASLSQAPLPEQKSNPPVRNNKICELQSSKHLIKAGNGVESDDRSTYCSVCCRVNLLLHVMKARLTRAIIWPMVLL